MDCLLVSLLKDAMPPNFAEKTFANSYKTSKFMKLFSLESFPYYGSLAFIRLFVAAAATVYQEPHFGRTEGQEFFAFLFDPQKFSCVNPLQSMI